MRTVAIIPARGGSKGIPRKNVYPLHGHPLLAHSVLAARAATRVDGVFVSTDDAEIAGVARAYGAGVIDRPAALSGDEASSESALIHALEVLAQQGVRPEVLVFVQCTSPLTLAEDIDGVVATMDATGADSVFTATPFYSFTWRADASGDMVGVNHDQRIRLRRQERAGEYLETGAVYAMRAEGFLSHRHRFFGRTRAYVVPRERAFEIDDLLDLAVVDALMGARGAA